MLELMVLKYRKTMLLVALISLSLLLIKGVTSIAAANVVIARKASIEKNIWNSSYDVANSNSELFFKINAKYIKKSKEIVPKSKLHVQFVDFKKSLASITTLSLQAATP